MSTTFAPDYAVHPGETLSEWLEEDGMSQVELATRIGMSGKALNQILHGIAPVTPVTALRLESATGIPAKTWNSLQALFAEDSTRLEQNRAWEPQIDFLHVVPFTALRKLGIVTSPRRDVAAVRQACDFFGVADPSAWQDLWLTTGVAYRKSPAFEADPGAVATWLRLGEIQASDIELGEVSKSHLRKLLPQIRALTLEPNPNVFLPALQDLCARAGVAFVVVPEVPGSRCSGATRWIKKHPVVQLSLRHKTDDHFWFTFFHELAHVLLHGQREVFLDGGSLSSAKTQKQETEADSFAREILIPESFNGALSDLKSINSIKGFARDVGVSPGIVVGRLQFDGVLAFKSGNGLKTRFVSEHQQSAARV